MNTRTKHSDYTAHPKDFIHLLFAIMGIYLLCSFEVVNDTNTIKWNNQGLKATDFNVAKELPGNQVATSCTGLNYLYEDGRFVATAIFERNKSYISSKILKNPDHILLHEQGHFDIAEIYARKLNIKLLFVKDFSVAEALFDRSLKEMAEFQNLYDSETDHSEDLDAQERWNMRIKGLLK